MTLKSNAEQLAVIAQETGADVIRGPVRYPGHLGDVQVGGVDIGEHLYELKGQDVVIIVAPLFPAHELPTFCGLCGESDEGDECPTCRAEPEEAKSVIEERLRQDRDEKDRLIKDVEEWLQQRRC